MIGEQQGTNEYRLPVGLNLENVRLVATDLDGTLLRPDGTVSTRTNRALIDIAGAGMPIVFVSARPPRFVRRLAANLGVDPLLALCCNGAIAYDLLNNRIVRHRCIDPDVIATLVAKLRRQVPGVCFAAEIGLSFGWEAEYSALEDALVEPGGTQAEIVSLCQRPVTKLIVRHQDMSAGDLLPAVREIAGDSVEVTHSGTVFVEISASGVEKAAALELLAEDLGILAEHVLAFGDMPNDIPLLKWAGTGLAMANAHPDVMRAADGVTCSNEDDGVAIVLEQLLERQSPG